MTKPSLPIPKRGERTAAAVSTGRLCVFEPLIASSQLPCLVRPTVEHLNLAGWLRSNVQLVEQRLRHHGGLLFRGFDVLGTEQFEECATIVSGALLEYEYRSTPRTRVAGRVYTSTEYPQHRSIPHHNEMSYARAWPLKLWFYAVTPAARGGHTPIADSGKVFERIPGRIRDRFAERGVMYVRNYGHGVDLPWQDVFQTTEPDEVERLCRRVGMEFEWKADDGLVTRQVCQAVATHPADGQPLWFNQAHLFHISSLDPAAGALLIERFGERNLPRNAYYGDGSAIDAADLECIREAYERETIDFAWQTGDVLLLDNMRVAHGRQAYEGPRRLLAAMAERFGQADLCVEM